MSRIPLIDDLKAHVTELECNNAFGLMREVWNYVLNAPAETQVSVFREIVEEVTPLELGKIDEDKFASELKNIITEHSNVVDLERQTFDGLIQQNLTEESFYKELLYRAQDKVLLNSEESRIVFFLLIWLDPRIPYYHIDPKEPSKQTEAPSLSHRLQDALKRARFIVYRGYLSPFKQATLLLELTNNLENEEKALFWALVLRIYSVKMNQSGSKKARSSESEKE